MAGISRSKGMGQRRAIAFRVMLLASALAAAWFFSRTDGVRPNAADLADGGNTPLDSSPLALPDPIHPAEGLPEDQPEHTQPAPEATNVVVPMLDTPDYGPAIQRGGAYVDFELYDPNGARVPIQFYRASLWRKIGDYWIADELRTDVERNLIACDGLGEQGLPSAGLEPGSYELELTSAQWGNFRHDFSVSRGERRTDRLTTPNSRVAVCLRFSDSDGRPISYLPSRPRVSSTSTALDPIERNSPETVSLRDSPFRPISLPGGIGWSGSGSPDRGRRLLPNVPPLYPTDDGAWWIWVFSGASNTISVNLNAELWGLAEYTCEDTFTSRSEVEVVLSTPAEFEKRVLEWGKPLEGYTPGDRNIREVQAEVHDKVEFDPYSAAVKPGVTRVVVETVSSVPVLVQMSINGTSFWRVMYARGDLHWYDLSARTQLWIRLVDDRLLVTPWESVDVSAGGVLVLGRSTGGALVTFTADGLTPTLRAFAYSIDFDIAAMDPPEPEPSEDPVDEVEEDPSDVPNRDLAENPNHDPSEGGVRPTPRPIERRDESPSSNRFKLVIHPKDGRQKTATIASSEAIDSADISHGLQLRTCLRGVSRFRRGSSGGASMGPNGNYWFEPVVLPGRWEKFDTGDQSFPSLLSAGSLQPRFDNVFAGRAVGPAEEGLPWAKGVIIEYEKDEVAQQVREICRRHDNKLAVGPLDINSYAAGLEAAEETPEPEGLRALLGQESYDAFETDEQRLWFARQGAWYDTSRKVFSDEQGYFAIQDPPLEPGNCYVLYLWTDSRDDLKPDARFAFQVDEHGVADVGAIHLPTYSQR
ncbi:MAG: hypothetical protein KDB90_16855 [Planctomycetes bacterium]|nr:hypothetical protein [Planctomycetota bacterium]